MYEDGHVERIWVTSSTLDKLHKDDHLYLNHDGEIAAGKDSEDAVIGDSHHQPYAYGAGSFLKRQPPYLRCCLKRGYLPTRSLAAATTASQ